jgi:hypothetical protein
MNIYSTRGAAQAAKPFIAQSTGRSQRDLVVVRAGTGWAVRTRASLERWISKKGRRGA